MNLETIRECACLHETGEACHLCAQVKDNSSCSQKYSITDCATSTYNFKRVKITQMCLIGDQKCAILMFKDTFRSE